MRPSSRTGRDGKGFPPPARLPDCTFAVRRSLAALDTGWNRFRGPYLLYASSGVLELEVDRRRWLMPPERAAFVAAQTPIRVRARRPIETASILFARETPLRLPVPCRVFAVNGLAREMILHAMRWQMERDPDDAVAERFFLSLAEVCRELSEGPEQLWLPSVGSTTLRRAMSFMVENLERSIPIDEIARAVHVSERTLSRRFETEARMTCGQFLHRARMMRAAELLAGADLGVTEVAFAVGFRSSSSFAAAFRRQMQESPRDYRRRFRSSGPAPRG